MRHESWRTLSSSEGICLAKAPSKPAALLTRGDIEGVRPGEESRWCVFDDQDHHVYVGRRDNAPYEAKPRNRHPEVEGVVTAMILAEEYLHKSITGTIGGCRRHPAWNAR